MAEDSKKLAAPYASWSSTLNFFNKLRETTVPSRIDPSVFGKASGATSYSVIAALKYLKLIDENGKPSDDFRLFVGADDAQRKALLRDLLRARYPTLHGGEIDLSSVTSGQFDEHIREQFDIRGSTVDKVATFFITAATFADEPLSPHLLKRKSVAGSQASKKTTRQRKADEGTPQQIDRPPGVKGDEKKNESKPLEYQLIDLMSEPDIELDVKNSIWSLVQYLAQRKQKAGDETN